MSEVKPGDRVTFPKARAKWNRDRQYLVNKVTESGLQLSTQNENGDAYHYLIPIEDCAEMGMSRVPNGNE